MKSIINKVLPIICLALTVVGCHKEDNSNCIRENTTLLFKYLDNNGIDILTRDIHSVDAFIFDQNKKLVVNRRFEIAELNSFAGWKLNLPSGDYNVVCWGNAGTNSQMNNFVPGVTTLDDGFMEIPSNITTTGDRIYYAPYKLHQQKLPEGAVPPVTTYDFKVVARRENVKEMYFTRAHRTVNVYIIGYSNSEGPVAVTGTQLAAKYDFYYSTRNPYRNLTQTAQPVTTPDGPGVLAAFHFWFAEITNITDFIIRQGVEGSILETVNLKKFVESYPSIYPPTKYGNTIDILVRFSDLGVTVTIPGWKEKPISPGV
jgi:hypothetical protein